MVKISTYIISLLSLCAVGCANRFEAASTEGDVEITPFNITIEELHSITATSSTFECVSDLVICGSVTANDEEGNFYRSFMLEQRGYAVEILEGSLSLASRYPEGAVVTVALKGLWMSRSDGVLQVGMEASAGSSYELDYLSHDLLVDQHIFVSTEVEEVTPLVIELSQLESTAEFSAMCGRLVKIEGVSLVVSDDVEEGSTTWADTNTFVDGSGVELECYSSYYCDYADEIIPEGSGSITGILQSDGSPMIKMRGVGDFVLYEQ